MVNNIPKLEKSNKKNEIIIFIPILTKFNYFILITFLISILIVYTCTLYPHFAGGDRYY